jgi:hypothetical protein
VPIGVFRGLEPAMKWLRGAVSSGVHD